jgi:dienelactone hydrolase
MEHSVPVPLDPKVGERRERDGYRIERVAFHSEAGVVVPAYVLIPHGVGPERRVPAVLCLQGVVPGGKDELAGETGHNAQAAAGVKRFRDDFARQFARAGLVALAIDMRFDGERAHHSATDPLGLNSRAAAMLLAHKYATMMGQSLFGLNLFDARRALDYLETRPEVRRDAIGCAGFSFGSTLGAWLAVIDRRIKVVALEGTWPSWRRLALQNLAPVPANDAEKPFHWMAAASYQILPGFLRELDLNLTVAAVAPTPMLLSYESDVRRVHADRGEAERDIAPVRKAYAAFRASESLRVVHVEGGHYWREDVIVPWLTARLHQISR